MADTKTNTAALLSQARDRNMLLEEALRELVDAAGQLLVADISDVDTACELHKAFRAGIKILKAVS